MSRVVVIVNAFDDVTERQTTAMLAAAAVANGNAVYVAEVDGLAMASAQGKLRRLLAGVPLTSSATSASLATQQLHADPHGQLKWLELNEADTVLLRTNPGRDEQRSQLHGQLLELSCLLERSGIRVVNQPGQLQRFASKSALLMLPPEHRPEMMVSSKTAPIVDFVRQLPQPSVVKPLVGSRGRDVLRLTPDDPDLTTTLAATFTGRCMVAQEFIDSDQPGDQRIVVLDGRILEVDGRIAGIARRPGEGDFRGNLHAGGQASPLTLNDAQIAAVECSAELLMRHGIRLAGVDIVGDKVIEFNVFSTGGLYDATRFAQIDFCAHIIRQLVPA